MSKLLIEYLRPDQQPLRCIDLGLEFITSMGVPLANVQRPFRIEAEGKRSSAGNIYFDYEHRQLPLPDGLNTLLRIGGLLLPMGEQRLSAAGNPTREGQLVIMIDGVSYEVKAYFTKGRNPYWVKVHAHKAANSGNLQSANLSGGKIV